MSGNRGPSSVTNGGLSPLCIPPGSRFVSLASCLVQGACDEPQAVACDHATVVRGADVLPGIRASHDVAIRNRHRYVWCRSSGRRRRRESRRYRHHFHRRDQRAGPLYDSGHAHRPLHGHRLVVGIQNRRALRHSRQHRNGRAGEHQARDRRARRDRDRQERH